MGAFSELDMERDNFYSPGDAPAGFSMEDDPLPFETQSSSQQQAITIVQPAAVKDTLKAKDTQRMSADTTGTSSSENSGADSDAESGKKADDAEDEDAKRKAHEEAEAKRKAEFDARQAAKKAAEQEQLTRLAAMNDDEVMAASMERVKADTEKLTRRNMKECVAEYIQTMCIEDPTFARKTMHPRKSMIRCFQYITRKARDYVQDELKANGIQPGPGQQGYGSDVPDDLCYQWAVDYFNDPDVKEDHEEDEKFEPKPYYGGKTSKSKSGTKNKGKAAGKKEPAPKKTEPKEAPKKSSDGLGQISLGDFMMPEEKAG